MHSCHDYGEMRRARWMMKGRGHGHGFGGRGHGPRGGGPFGRHRGGPFGGRGSRMFDSGALRLVVLGLIAEEPRHGYDIIKALETRFQGAYSPSPGAIYPMLQMMEEADLVVSHSEGNKKLYTITEAGRTWLEENRTELDRINAQLEEASGDMQGVALGDAIRDLRRSIYRRMRGGEMNAEQAQKAVEILKKARDDLDRL